MTDDYMTTQEVAELMNCTKVYVTILVKRGHFPGTRKMDPTRLNSALRIPRASVERFMQSQIVSPESKTDE